MEVRAKKSLGQHFLVDLGAAQRIVAALERPGDVLEIGPGMGVLTRYLLQRQELNLKMVELDGESVQFLRSHFSYFNATASTQTSSCFLSYLYHLVGFR